MGVYVVRAFVKLRELLTTNRELADKLDPIRELMRPPEPHRRGIG